MTDRPLTEKQRAFIAAYVGEARGNGTQAARLAGYTGDDKTLAVQATRTLKTASVQAALSTYRTELARIETEEHEHALMTSHEMGVRLSRMARGDETLTEEKLVNAGKDGFVVERLAPGFTHQLGAMDALRKMLGYEAPTKVEHAGVVGLDHTLSLTPEQDEALAEWLVARRDPVIMARLAELRGPT